MTPRPRPRRYPLIAPVELTDVQSSARLNQVISDLSAFGCHISTRQMWPIGSDVDVHIVHNGEKFTARAEVVYGRPMLGMGVVFTHVGPASQSVLDTWIAGLKDAMRGK
ncbi:MAG: PilZ domain-containing protein [Candidatus Acidiferrales bacterium]